MYHLSQMHTEMALWYVMHLSSAWLYQECEHQIKHSLALLRRRPHGYFVHCVHELDNGVSCSYHLWMKRYAAPVLLEEAHGPSGDTCNLMCLELCGTSGCGLASSVLYGPGSPNIVGDRSLSRLWCGMWLSQSQRNMCRFMCLTVMACRSCFGPVIPPGFAYITGHSDAEHHTSIGPR